MTTGPWIHALAISVLVSLPIALLQASLSSLTRQYPLQPDELRQTIAEVLERERARRPRPRSQLTWRKFLGNFRARVFWRVLLSTWLAVCGLCLATSALLIISLGL